jgi:drug/metabolite transporter (DMT)-like permease
MLDELGQRVGQRRDRSIHDLADDVSDEPAADHRTDAGDLLGCLRPASKPIEDRLLDRVRDARITDIVRRRGVPVAEHPDQFLDVERDAVSSRLDRGHEIGGRRLTAHQQPGHPGRVLARQRREPDLLRVALPEKACPPGPEAGMWTQEVDSIGADEERGDIAQPPGHACEHLQAQVVGPVEVFEPDEARRLGEVGEQVGDVEHEQPAAPAGFHRCVDIRVGETVGQRTTRGGKRRDSPHGASQVDEQRRGHVLVLRREPPVRGAEPGERRLFLDGAEEPRLADSGVPGKQDDLAPTLGDRVKTPGRHVQQVIATDEDGTDDRADADHGAQSMRAGEVCEDRRHDIAAGANPMTRRGLVLFALMSVIWGIPYLFIRVAVAEIPPAALVLARTALAAAILLPIALVRVDLRPVIARWRWVVAFAAVEIAIPWVALGSAEQHLSSSLTGLLIAGVPLVGTALALATGGADRLGRTGLLGLLIGLVGVAAIVGGDYATSDPTALLEIVVVVIGYAVGPAILARRLGGLPTVGVMALSLALCAVVYIPIAAVQWPTIVPSANVIASVIILAVVCTAVAFLVFAALIDEIGPVRATVITYVNPAVAAVLGVLVLHETFTVPMALGFALVILGSTLATRRSRSVSEALPSTPDGALRPAPE